MNPEQLSTGEQISGFVLESNQPLPEYSSQALHFRHEKTGCEVFHLWNNDPENLYALTFRTPPQDDTGASHILEHSVLCGSRRFTVKDPFLLLLKSSLQTFLNAFTFPDKTVYPASSKVEKDFFNLLLVTGDAVFFPLLQPEVFMQEAHHLEPAASENHSGRLIRTGVVYNEMKGVFSSAESVVAEASLRSLFPDTPYGFESGGLPAAIATLTHEQLVSFHRRFYHPANCRIFLYGNIPTPVTLEFLESNFLSGFAPARVDSRIALQPRWTHARRFERTYPAEAGKSTITLNWLTVPVIDPIKLLSLEVLSELLVGNEGAPLHHALLESKLGDDLSPATGLDTELNEVVFSVGLRGTEPEHVEAIERLVFSTLRNLVDRGVPEELLQAALHRVEFRNSEIRRGGRPYSLTLMRRTLRGWLHGSEPKITLEFRQPMVELRGRIARGGYFEGLIREHLVGNPHRSTLVVRPDPSQQSREQKRELKQIRESLDAEGEKRLSERLKALKGFQEREDDPEVMKRIPALHLSDLRREVEVIPTERLDTLPERPFLFHDLFTNGVVYLDLCFDTSALDPRTLYLLPLFARAISGSGLPGVPYYEIASKLSLFTGGFGASLSADTEAAPTRKVNERLIVRVKMLEQNIEAATGLVGRLLGSADFRDLERLSTIIFEMRNDLRASIVPGGSHYAALRASARISEAAEIEEKWKGVSQYLWLHDLAAEAPGNLPRLAGKLESIRSSVFVPSRLTVNLTCARESVDRAAGAAAALVASLPASRVVDAHTEREDLPSPPELPPEVALETVIGSMNVSFVAHALSGSRFGSRENAHEAVLAHYLSTGFLWERVRMKGGAYGAFASANGLEGLFGFSSYRDPNTLKTLDAFREALAFAFTADLEPQAYEQIVLGAAGREDRPMAPGEKGFVALKRHLLGIEDEQRQSRREALIDCSPAQLKAAAGRLLERFDDGVTAIVTHAEAVQSEQSRLRDLKATTFELPG